MVEFTALDVHKQYTFASVERDGQVVREQKIVHQRGAIRGFLAGREPGSPVAVEATGNWYWVVDEIEAAGCVPRLVHPKKAKLMMGLTNKTDKLDARGLNVLQRNKTLPTVWIPPGELRDQRDLPRTRMVLTRQRTQLKNRLHATLAKYGLAAPQASDIFSPGARGALRGCIRQLPEHSRFAVERELEQIDALSEQVGLFETRIEEVLDKTRAVELLDSLPGVGFTLAVVLALEIGDVERFASAEKLAGYSGTTPRVKASGGKVRFGGLRQDVNRYLKWALVEAANVVCLHQERWANRHVAQLYLRIRGRKGHPKAIGAVARHLAEAAYWMLKKGEAYKEPAWQPVSSTKARARL
ncbi:MAG: IS110 family transposase [Planctomycetota bacterium]|nr:IS110 family transposase [Planctomycetota bacterium]